MKIAPKLGKRVQSTIPGSENVKDSKPFDVLGIVFFSALSLGSFSLGVWQVKRYYWKVDLISQIKDKAIVAAESISDDQNLCMIQDQLKGRIISLNGAFDHTREFLLGPRSAPPGLYEAAQGMATNAQVCFISSHLPFNHQIITHPSFLQGFYVLTPFIRKDGGAVIVNRGWVPLGKTFRTSHFIPS